jgi:1,6-anhydro-N-acetylmuramate kinase
MKRLKEGLTEKMNEKVKLLDHDNIIRNKNHKNVNDAKEGMLFALLAFLYHHEIKSNILSVTGATKQVVLGKKTF